ncbi:MAG: hypothetical protein ACTHK6_02075 [Solirubrobacterales bacterium]
MDLNFTVTLRWLSPARGCDVATARTCLIRPWAMPGAARHRPCRNRFSR